MNNILESGKYIVAVSGGVDSVVLLSMLKADPGLQLVVAHFDHGIREDSAENANFVAGLAALQGLECVMGSARLGKTAGEDIARNHRYAFLREVCKLHTAKAIVTAHHQDDVIETALINVTRGTKRRGLVSLKSTDDIKRPLLGFNKKDIWRYAVDHKLEWFEDSTNQEMSYLRNRLRGILYKRLDAVKRAQIIALLATISFYDAEINSIVNEILTKSKKTNSKKFNSLPRSYFKDFDEIAASEIVASWLRNNKATFDKNTIKRVVNGARQLRNGSKIDIDKHYYCLLSKEEIIISGR